MSVWIRWWMVGSGSLDCVVNVDRFMILLWLVIVSSSLKVCLMDCMLFVWDGVVLGLVLLFVMGVFLLWFLLNCSCWMWFV